MTLEHGTSLRLAEGEPDHRSETRLAVCIWQAQPVCAGIPDSPARRALGRLARKGFLRAAFLLAVLEAEGSRTSPLSEYSTRPLQSLGSAVQTRTSGLLSGAGQRNSPTAGPLLLTFRTKGGFGHVGAPRNLGLWRVQQGTAFSDCLPQPGTLSLTALPAEGMPFPPRGLAPTRTEEDGTKAAGG